MKSFFAIALLAVLGFSHAFTTTAPTKVGVSIKESNTELNAIGLAPDGVVGGIDRYSTRYGGYGRRGYYSGDYDYDYDGLRRGYGSYNRGYGSTYGRGYGGMYGGGYGNGYNNFHDARDRFVSTRGYNTNGYYNGGGYNNGCKLDNLTMLFCAPVYESSCEITSIKC